MAAGILLSLDEHGIVARVLRNRQLAGLGIISYGFSFFHGMIGPNFQLVAQHVGVLRRHGYLLLIDGFALSYLTAWISFYMYESHFLKLKDRLAPGHKSVPSGREMRELVG